jgi:hypothetical protein
VLLGVIRFTAFLLVLIVYVAALAKLMNLIGRAQQGDRTYARLLYGQAGILVTWLATFTLVWVLSGFWDTRLVILAILATETATLLGLLLGAISGRGSVKTSLLSVSMELGVKHPVFWRIVLQLLPLVVILAYVITCGIFLLSLEGDELPRQLLQATLLFLLALILGGQLYQLAMLASPYLDEETREAVMTSHIVGLVPLLLIFSILLSSYDAQGPGISLSTSDMSISVSIWAILILLGLFLVRTLLPFIIGSKKSAVVRSQYLQERQAFLTQAEEMLAVPTSTLYDEKLAELEAEARRKYKDLIRKHPLLELKDYDGSNVPLGDDQDDPALKNSSLRGSNELAESMTESNWVLQGLEPTIEKYWEEAQAIDPRFEHLNWYRAFCQALEDARLDLNNRNEGQDRESAAAQWGQAFKKKRANLGEIKLTVPRARTPVVAGAVALCGIVASTLTDQFGSWLWDSFSRQLGA